MSDKVLVTSPYPEFDQLVRSVGYQGFTIITVHGVLEDAVVRVKEVLSRQDIQVIVSRGATANLLKREVQVPVISAEFTDFDLLYALWQAKDYGSPVAHVSFPFREGYSLDWLGEIVGAEFRQYYYTCTKELRQAINEAYRDGARVIVGGGKFGSEISAELGLPNVNVFSSKRSVIQALDRVRELLAAKEKERRNTEQLATVIRTVNEGVVFLDEAEKILVINHKAKSILKLGNKDVVGRSWSEVVPNENRRKISSSGDSWICLKDGEIEIVINRTPVWLDKKRIGGVLTLQEVSRIQQLEQKLRQEIYNKGLVAKTTFDDIVYKSKTVSELVKKAREFAATDSTILIQGESGTGKELYAQSIHLSSLRREGPFVAVNCAALPENLLESELFGYEEGAFTGSRKGGKKGLFEIAHRGTIFLDEIQSISPALQARLLRVLQEREIMRIGGDRVIPVDVRVVAATNRDLVEAVKEGSFRQDLYFRINVLTLTIPPLRERKEDIHALIRYFLKILNRKHNRNVLNLSPKMLNWCLQYPWPGNVRELENFLERVVLLSGYDYKEQWEEELINEMQKQAVLLPDRGKRQEDSIVVKMDTLKNMEKQLIHEINNRLGAKQDEVAAFLGISRTTLWKKTRNSEQLK